MLAPRARSSAAARGIAPRMLPAVDAITPLSLRFEIQQRCRHFQLMFHFHACLLLTLFSLRLFSLSILPPFHCFHCHIFSFHYAFDFRRHFFLAICY
jgi:hypothetical protein